MLLIQAVATVTLPSLALTVVLITPVRTVIHPVTGDVGPGQAASIPALVVTSVAVVERLTQCAAGAVFVSVNQVDAVVNRSLNEELIGHVVWEIFNLKHLYLYI